MNSPRAVTETFEQLSARRKRESRALFWFREWVTFEMTDPTEPLREGTIKDVIQTSKHDGYWGFDGFVYLIEDEKTGREYYCREVQVRYPWELSTDHPERQATLEKLQRERYPHYYQ